MWWLLADTRATDSVAVSQHITSIKMSDPKNQKRASKSLDEDETASSKSKKQQQSRPAPTEGGTFDDLLQVSRSEATIVVQNPQTFALLYIRIAPCNLPRRGKSSQVPNRRRLQSQVIPWGLHI